MQLFGNSEQFKPRADGGFPGSWKRSGKYASASGVTVSIARNYLTKDELEFKRGVKNIANR